MRTSVTGSATAGFTLLELLLVVAIIAILAGYLVPSFGGSYERARFRENVQLMGHLAASAARIAVAEKCVVQLNFDTDTHTAWLTSENVEVDLAAAGNPVTLPEGCEITGVEILLATPEQEEEGADAVRFYADGRADGAYVVCSRGEANRLTLFINPVTAEPSVLRGERSAEEWTEFEERRTSRSQLGDEASLAR